MISRPNSPLRHADRLPLNHAVLGAALAGIVKWIHQRPDRGLKLPLTSSIEIPWLTCLLKKAGWHTGRSAMNYNARVTVPRRNRHRGGGSLRGRYVGIDC